jgi:Spy/CpxP family protein refolding chaperone
MEQSMSNAAMTTNERAAAATRRSLRWLVAAMVLAVSATVALSAWAQPGPGGHRGGGMEGPGLFLVGHGRGLDRMLDSVNASDAQRSKIKQIAQQAATDLKAQREQSRALHEQSLRIFTAPGTVDAAAAESVRAQMVAQHDAASRRMLQAMLDISGVLTPEQRAKLGEIIQQRHQQMRERMQQRMQGQPPAQQ